MNIQNFKTSSDGDLLEMSFQCGNLNSVNPQKKNKITIYITLPIEYPTKMQVSFALHS